MGLYSRIDTIPIQSWLWVCTGLGVLILLIAYVAGRIVDNHPEFALDDRAPESDPPPLQPSSRNPFVESSKLVFKSKYLLSIASIVFLYEIVSTCMDFQFTSTIAHYLDGPDLGDQFSLVFAITNVTALCVQILLTSTILTGAGVGFALLVTPALALCGSAGFMMFPILWAGSLLNTLDNGFNYSINQSAKEALYVPLRKDEKYKGKAFIDMFVQRFAKGVAILVTLVITQQFADFTDLRWISIFSACVIALWIVAAIFAGRRYRTLAAEKEAEHASRRSGTA